MISARRSCSLQAWKCKALTNLVLQDDVQGVDDSGNVAEDCEEDVDTEIGTAASLEEDSERREEYGEDDLADVASGESHCDGVDW